MAETASTYGTSPNPSKIGMILSSIGKFTVDSTIAEFLACVNGRKKVHEFVQQKAKGISPPLPPPLLSLNYKKRPGGFKVTIRDVQKVIKKEQEEAIRMPQLHKRCLKSSKGTGTYPSKKMPREACKESDHLGTSRKLVFIRSRL